MNLAANKSSRSVAKILLVDDDEAFRASTVFLLQHAGYEVVEARDGEEATRQLNRLTVDLVLTDVLLPGRDGLEVIKDIRMRWPELKIIALSGGGFCRAGLYIDLSLKLGAVSALQKPFPGQKLLTMVEAALAGRSDKAGSSKETQRRSALSAMGGLGGEETAMSKVSHS